MPDDKHIRYGEPGVLSDERFLIRAVTHDDEGISWGGNAHVLLRDEDTGEEWHLSVKAANELANALKSVARLINPK